MTEDTTPITTPETTDKRGSMLSNTLFTYGTNATAAVLSLVNVLIVARVLGAGARGEIAFLITVATMTGWVAGLSVQEANANLAGSEPALRSRLATNSLLLALVFGLLAAGAVAAIVAVFPSVGGPVSHGLLAASLATVPVAVAKLYLQFLLQAEYAFGVTNVAWLSGPFVTATANGILATAGWISVETAFAAWIVGQCLGVVIMTIAIATRSGFGRPDRPLAGRAVGFGLKTHAGRLLSIGNYRGDQWILGAVSGSRELGLYSVAVAWAELLFYLPGVLTLVQRPDLVRATPAHAARTAARVFRIAVLLSAIAAVGLILAAPLLCTLVFGNEFSGSTNMLRILALGAVGVTAIDLFPNALTAQRLPIHGTGGIAAAFFVMLALDVALIPPFGGIGASAATTIAYMVGGGVAAFIFVRALNCPPADLIPRLGELPLMWEKLRGRSARA